MRRHAILAVLFIALALLSLVDGGRAGSSQSYVTRSGTQLLLDGEPYRFSGFNVYNANSSGLCWYAMDGGPALDDALTAMGGYNDVIRAWFFQSLATDGGQRDWSAFDHTLSVAAQHGVRVIVTLGNQWGDCEPGAGYRDESWYATGYTEIDPSGTVSYRDWVAEAVTRYKDNPTVLMWQLLNEAEVLPYSGGPCAPGDAPAETLRAWASDVSALIKSIDANHLVSLGTIGGGQCGSANDHYQYVHDLATIDVCEYHDYGSPLAPIPGDQWNGLQVRIDQCNALDKPLFVGEMGINPDTAGGTYEDRAAALTAKLNAQFGAGIDGVVVWAWSNLGSTLDNFDVGPGDPLIDALALGPETDTDGDGCDDEREAGEDEGTGGLRDPLDAYDFYDVNDTRDIDLSDTLAVLAHFGHGSDDDPFDDVVDRFIPNASEPWRTAAADDGIDLSEALANLKSFGHSCG